MAVPKTAALPLGDAPTEAVVTTVHHARQPTPKAAISALVQWGPPRYNAAQPDGPLPETSPSLRRSGGHHGTWRSIAQPGSAPASGAGGRVFESLYSDQSTPASREVGVFHTDRVAGSSGAGSALPRPSHLRRSIPQVVRMVVAIDPDQRIEAESEVARGIPGVHAALHAPGDRSVPERVRNDVSAEAAVVHQLAKGLVDAVHRTTVETRRGTADRSCANDEGVPASATGEV